MEGAGEGELDGTVELNELKPDKLSGVTDMPDASLLPFLKMLKREILFLSLCEVWVND